MKFSRNSAIAAASLAASMLLGAPLTWAKDPQPGAAPAQGAEGEAADPKNPKGKPKGNQQGGDNGGPKKAAPNAQPGKPLGKVLQPQGEPGEKPVQKRQAIPAPKQIQEPAGEPVLKKAIPAPKTLPPTGSEPVIQKPALKPVEKPKSVESDDIPPATNKGKPRLTKPADAADPNAKVETPAVLPKAGKKRRPPEEAATPDGSKSTVATPPKNGEPSKQPVDDNAEAQGRSGSPPGKPDKNKGTASKPAVINPSEPATAATPPTETKQVAPAQPAGPAPAVKPAGTAPAAAPANFEDIKKGRRETKSGGGKDVVIKESDNRTIIKQGNKIVIQHDDTGRIRQVAPNAVFEKGTGGSTIAIVERPGGIRVYSESDANGQLIRSYRRGADGRDVSIIDNRGRGYDKRRKRNRLGKDLAIGAGIGLGIAAGAAIFNSVVDVPAPRVRIPREKYIVEYDDASEDDVYEALSAPPVDDVSDRYTLDQIRATPRLRERMRRIDLDDINFEFGSWQVDPSQYRKLDRVARAMMRVINRSPNEVFMIEGYTDAVGSREDNLSLSDRRAESVAEVLSKEYQVPFENLTTQGYGEDYLKVETDAAERLNRRVAVRRITPLLSSNSAAPPPGASQNESDSGPDQGDGPDQGGAPDDQQGDADPAQPNGDYGPYRGVPPADKD